MVGRLFNSEQSKDQGTRLEICAEILVRSELGPHHPFVRINRALFG